jgi:hypothetical protein
MPTTMNKIIVKKYFEMWNTGNIKLAGEVLSPEYVDYAHPEIKSTESVKQSVVKVRDIFPDFNITIDMMISEGNMVAVLGNISRTEQEKKVIHKIMWLVTIVDGKMTELRTGNVILK